MDDLDQICPRFHRAIELVGKRWTGAIIGTLMARPVRFSEILEVVPGLHDRLLRRSRQTSRRSSGLPPSCCPR